jgi:VanZ family protein
MRKTLRLLPGVCVLILAVLSLLPAQDLWRTGLDNRIEHFVAYAGTAFVLGLSVGAGRRLWRQTAALWVYAGILELLQYLAPGRHPSIGDFAASASGATAGGLLALLVLAVLPAWWGSRRSL